jgi:hypothetical protein
VTSALAEGSSVASRTLELVYVRDRLTKTARGQWGLALLAAALVVLAFDWQLGSVMTGGAVGLVIWGAVELFMTVLPQVPRGDLPHPPVNSQIATSRFRVLSVAGSVVFAVAICAVLAWLADLWALGAVFVPGQFAGYACANTLGAALILRWERANGRRVVVDAADDEDDGPVLYAVDVGDRSSWK